MAALGRFNLAGYRFPDFLGIGSAQSGTSWMYANLRRQPGLFLPRQTELKYWDRHQRLPLLWYSRWFRGADSRLAGEITPSYCYLPLASIAEIRRVIPGVKLIYIVRDPVEREFSAARRHFARRSSMRLEELTSDDWLGHLRTVGFNPFSDHAANLRRWRSCFPREQLLVLFYDRLASEPVETLRRVGRFLGLSEVNTSRAETVVNKNRAAPMPLDVRRYLAATYARVGTELEAEFPSEVAAWG